MINYYIYILFCSCIEVRNDLMSMRTNVKGSIPVKLSLVVAFNAMPDSNKPRYWAWKKRRQDLHEIVLPSTRQLPGVTFYNIADISHCSRVQLLERYETMGLI